MPPVCSSTASQTKGSKAEVQPDGARIYTPIKRPDWYILHEHVDLKRKLGSGNFGDVFKAQLTLESRTIDVAVKTLKCNNMGKQVSAGIVSSVMARDAFSSGQRSSRKPL